MSELKWVEQLSLIKVASSALDGILEKLLEKGSCSEKDFETTCRNVTRIINSCSKLEKDKDCPPDKKTLANGIKQIAGTLLSTLDGLTAMSTQEYVNKLKDIEYLKTKLAKETEPIEIE